MKIELQLRNLQKTLGGISKEMGLRTSWSHQKRKHSEESKNKPAAKSVFDRGTTPPAKKKKIVSQDGDAEKHAKTVELKNNDDDDEDHDDDDEDCNHSTNKDSTQSGPRKSSSRMKDALKSQSSNPPKATDKVLFSHFISLYF